MTWYNAFLEQAHSDYSVFTKLNEFQFPLCHKLHYLQMATEKLAKAYQCTKNIPPPKKHSALLNMLRIIKGTPSIRQQLDLNNSKSCISYINSLMPIAKQIEDLAPVGSQNK